MERKRRARCHAGGRVNHRDTRRWDMSRERIHTAGARLGRRRGDWCTTRASRWGAGSRTLARFRFGSRALRKQPPSSRLHRRRKSFTYDQKESLVALEQLARPRDAAALAKAASDR